MINTWRYVYEGSNDKGMECAVYLRENGYDKAYYFPRQFHESISALVMAHTDEVLQAWCGSHDGPEAGTNAS